MAVRERQAPRRGKLMRDVGARAGTIDAPAGAVRPRREPRVARSRSSAVPQATGAARAVRITRRFVRNAAPLRRR